MSNFVVPVDYYPINLAAQRLKCEEIELLLLAHAGDITFYLYPDPTGLIYWEPVNIFDIGAIIIRGTRSEEKYADLGCDSKLTTSDLVLPRAELERAYELLNPEQSNGNSASGKKVHGNAERHATNREQVLKVAIGVLADYPDDCRGPKKDPSPEKWTAAILKHAKDYPPLFLGKESIEKNLEEAVNLRSRTARKGGE
ncbi:hypothetical protein AHW90_03605 [Salmonella enterica subsp. enterica]|nr:hypothetical protein [Salmonella enterica subsp. enterica]